MSTEKEANEVTIVEAQVGVVVPTPPNFLRLLSNLDAVTESATIDVADVTDAALRRLGALWTEALVANAARRRVG